MSAKEEAQRLIGEALQRRARNGGKHLHHKGCIHNLPPEVQVEMRGSNVDWWMRMHGEMPKQITPNEWVDHDPDPARPFPVRPPRRDPALGGETPDPPNHGPRNIRGHQDKESRDMSENDSPELAPVMNECAIAELSEEGKQWQLQRKADQSDLINWILHYKNPANDDEKLRQIKLVME